MKRMLINATHKEELRIALVNGQYLYDLNIENIKKKKQKSNIYKGKIVKLEPSLDAVFVDYGSKKNGFLPLKEISDHYFLRKNTFAADFRIEDFLKIGQEILVQIEKEERKKKGAFLTTFISLAGAYLVLMPNKPHRNGISRKIEGKDRIKIKEVFSILKLPKNMSVIIRTAGLGKSIAALELDLSIQLKNWKKIKKTEKKCDSPFLIYKEKNIVIRIFRDYLRTDIKEIIIDNPKILELAKKYVFLLGKKNFNKKIKLYTGKIPLFSKYQIESQINSAFQKKIRLSSGGSVFLETTEALTAIDINSSKSNKQLGIEETALRTNIEAIREIFRQIRLRDVSGLIVIDFIDMYLLKNKKKIEKKLKQHIKKDRARIKIGKISKFGLLEMSRQRIGSSLKELNYNTCLQCQGTGYIREIDSFAFLILRKIEEVFNEKTSRIYVFVPIETACHMLNEKRKIIQSIEKRKKIKIFIIPNKKLKSPNYYVLNMKKKKNIITSHELTDISIKKLRKFF